MESNTANDMPPPPAPDTKEDMDVTKMDKVCKTLVIIGSTSIFSHFCVSYRSPSRELRSKNCAPSIQTFPSLLTAVLGVEVILLSCKSA